MNKGGLIIIDNVLWHGEVADENNNDKFTILLEILIIMFKMIKELNK